MADTLDAPKGKAVLCNTDIHTGNGIHWIVVLPVSRDFAYIFDPLGANNVRVSSNGLQTTNTIVRNTGAMNVHFFPYRVQDKGNSLCGWYSIYVARLFNDFIQRGGEPSAANLDSLVISQFGKSATRDDILKLARAFK